MNSAHIPQFMLRLMLGLALLAPAVEAASISSVIVYGDSLSDNGNFFAATGFPGAPYAGGRRTNGPVAVEQLAGALGAPLIDFAWIGATTGVGNYADGGSPTGLGAGLLPGIRTVFDATVAGLGPYLSSALFVVWGGPNDFLSPSPLDLTPAAVVARAVGNEIGIVTTLLGMGAQHILVPGMPDLGLTPYFQSLGPAGAAQGSAATAAFNGALSSSLPSGVLFYDTAALIRDMVNNPASYGFTNVTEACFNGVTVCANPSQYLFFDDFHPSTAAAGYAATGLFDTVVPEPSTVGLVFVGLGMLVGIRRRVAKR